MPETEKQLVLTGSMVLLILKRYINAMLMHCSRLVFRLMYLLYANTPVGRFITRRALRRARIKYPDGHSILQTCTYGHIEILPIAVNNDNYCYLIVDSRTNDAVLIDVGDAVAVQRVLDANFVHPKAILCTHRHWDHCYGNVKMRSLHAHIDVYGGAIDRPKGTTKYIRDGDDIHVGSLHFSAHFVPGHTRGHLIYRLYTESTIPESVFTGDLLFIGGMGKVFECSMADMLQSLDSLDQFDSDTLIWPGHEYSLENLRFACHIEPDNDAAVEKRAAVLALRQQRMPTCPSTIAAERTYNPFLRTNEPSLLHRLGVHSSLPLFRQHALNAIRTRKDHFV